MGAEAWAGLPDELAGWPAWTPGEAQLADLELLTIGAFEPLQGFMTSADLAAMAERGTLADGTPWPIPVTLEVPEDAVPAGASHLVLQDQEGTPLAVLQITEQLPIRGYSYGEQALSGWRLAGPVTPLREPEHGPFRRLRRRPAEVRAELAKQGDAPVLAAVTRGALHRRQIGQLRHLADQMKARLLLLPLVAGPADVVVRPDALVRAVLAATQNLPAGTTVVPVPLPPGRAAPASSCAPGPWWPPPTGRRTCWSTRPTRPTSCSPVGPATADGPLQLPGLPIPIISAGDWAYDPPVRGVAAAVADRAGRRAERADPRRADRPARGRGESLPSWYTPEAVAHELRLARPPRDQRGLVMFFTGLSGSGKSTVARDLRDALSESGDRTVSLLDGDRVRHLLSAGLTFSRADRDLNIVRIGYVAAEIARHGGIAICAPIAPYTSARAQVREMAGRGRRLPARPRVDAAGGVRGAGPQGPVREGPGRPDQQLHRDL